MKPINVMSLFNGISCLNVALDRLYIPINNYYSSEIDKYANKIAQKNYPNTIQLGDLTKWKEWDVDFSQIDLLVAGFPCQAWSIAGKQKGDNDPRGALVHDLIDIWQEITMKNPNVKFLFENVRMKKEFIEYINGLFGTEPILINSALVSAQNRKRLYWTNIPNVTQPKDKHIYLKDIIEDDAVDRDKSYCIDANYYKGGNLDQYFRRARKQLVFTDKAQTLLATIYKENPKSMLKRKKFGLLVSDGSYTRKLSPLECERLQTLPDDYTWGVSNTQRYKCLGNGWTVDVITHILKQIKERN